MGKLQTLLLILFATVIFLAHAGQSFAHEAEASEGEATSQAKIEYNLAYPGILPDNPLYFLKAARDKMVSFLISDFEKKAEFNLLTSDKRVNAAYMLASRGKADLAVTTLSKSNNYLDQALLDLTEIKKTKKDINPQVGNLINAIHKHEDLVAGIKSKVGKSYDKRIKLEEQRLEKMHKSATKLLHK